MKLKAAPKSGVKVQFAPGEGALPPVPLAEIKLKRILVPVDFSAPSRKALNYAASFAKQFNAEILLLHVVEAVPTGPHYLLAESSSLESKLREDAAKQLAAWRQEIAAHTATRANVRSGTAYHEIIRAADETNADLIIMGTHGRTGLAHLFIESTAERVIRQAPCPAMVVGEHEHDFVEEPADARESR